MKLSPREQVLSIVAGVLVVGFGSLLLLRPLVARVRGVDEQVRRREVELQTARAIVGRLDAIRKEYEIHQARLHAGRDTTSDLISVLTRLADTSGVDIVNTRPSEPKTLDFYRELKIAITFEGSISPVVRFLYGLLADEGILDVRRLLIGRKPGAVDLLRCEADVVSVFAPKGKETRQRERTGSPDGG